MTREPPDYRMLWQISKFCNFTCEYCCAYTARVKHPEYKKYSPEHIARCFDDTGKTWHITITGGEPFLYPQFVELAKFLTNKHYLRVITNLSTNNIYEFADTVPPEKILRVRAGLHIVEREKRNKVNDFIKKFLYLQDKGINITMEYVTYPSVIPRLEKDMEYFKSYGIEAELKVYRGRYKIRRYPDAHSGTEKELFYRNPINEEEIKILNNETNFFGKLCYAGKKSFFMDASGNLFRCVSSGKKYGDFLAGQYHTDEFPKPCPFMKCICPYEGMYATINRKGSAFSIANEIVTDSIPKLIKSPIVYAKKRL